MDYDQMRYEIREAVQDFKYATFKQCDCFHRLNKGKNFITPNTEAMLSLDNGKYIVEVSSGSGMNAGTYIFGITVIEQDKDIING